MKDFLYSPTIPATDGPLETITLACSEVRRAFIRTNLAARGACGAHLGSLLSTISSKDGCKDDQTLSQI